MRKFTFALIGAVSLCAVAAGAHAKLQDRAVAGKPDVAVGAKVDRASKRWLATFCGFQRVYLPADFIRIYQGGVLIGAVYRPAGCYYWL